MVYLRNYQEKQSKHNYSPLFRKYLAMRNRRKKVERKKCRWQQSPLHADDRERLRHLHPIALHERPLFFYAVSHGLSCGVTSNGEARADAEGGQKLTTSPYAILRSHTTVALSLNRPIISSHNPQSHDPARRKKSTEPPLVSPSYRRSKARPFFNHSGDHRKKKQLRSE